VHACLVVSAAEILPCAVPVRCQYSPWSDNSSLANATFDKSKLSGTFDAIPISAYLEGDCGDIRLGDHPIGTHVLAHVQNESFSQIRVICFFVSLFFLLRNPN